MKRKDGVLYKFDGFQWRRAVLSMCGSCGLEFVVSERYVRHGNGLFCSQQCQRGFQARINAESNRTVGMTAAERKKRWSTSVSPEVIRAHKIVEREIANGSLVRMPCEKCGACRVDAHHDDYSKPLAVRWLCRAHHLEHHRAGENWQLRKSA